MPESQRNFRQSDSAFSTAPIIHIIVSLLWRIIDHFDYFSYEYIIDNEFSISIFYILKVLKAPLSIPKLNNFTLSRFYFLFPEEITILVIRKPLKWYPVKRVWDWLFHEYQEYDCNNNSIITKIFKPVILYNFNKYLHCKPCSYECNYQSKA